MPPHKIICKHEIEPSDEWEWLQEVHITAKIGSLSVGDVHARLISRSSIRRTFWRDLEEPSEDTSLFGFDRFDR
jgi:hypothetical protein